MTTKLINRIKLIPLVAKVGKKEAKKIKGSIYTIKKSIICLFKKLLFTTENATAAGSS